MFGDISDLKEVLESSSKDDTNHNSSPKESTGTKINTGTKAGNAPQTPVLKTSGAHSYGEVSGSGRWDNKVVTPDQLTFPTPSPKPTKAVGTSIDEKLIDTGGMGNTATIINQTIVDNTVVRTGSVPAVECDGTSSNHTTPASNSAITASNSSGDLVSLSNSAIPDKEVAVPASPQRPPATPPRLFNVPLNHVPTSARRYGPANHNEMPSKPDTPLADQLRAEFWVWHRQEKQLLLDYRKAYKTWVLFTTDNDNKAKADFSATSEPLESSAIAAQVAWAKHQQSFNTWKTANPAVDLIIANIHNDAKALKAAEKAKAERDELIQELQGKPEERQKKELSDYDTFTHLMKESREREVWRSRVETQVKAQEMIEAQRQAVVDEQKRIAAEAAAEEERKKKEAAAEEERKKNEAAAEEERKKKEAAAETERKKKEAEAEEAKKAAKAKAAEQSNARDSQTATGDVHGFQF